MENPNNDNFFESYLDIDSWADDLRENNILCTIAAFESIDLPNPRGSMLHILAAGLVVKSFSATL